MTNNEEDGDGMDWFEPVSEVAGNFEIVFNKKKPEWDEYEMVSEQVVLTLGKTGRANRLTFNELSSDNLQSLISSLETVKELVEKIEELESEELDYF